MTLVQGHPNSVHIDHIIPVNAKNLTVEEKANMWNAKKNSRAICRQCNLSKGNKRNWKPNKPISNSSNLL